MEERRKSSNEELMLRLQKGDLDAFESLYDRFHKQIYNFILRFVGERTLAEDIVQETFLRLLNQRKHYKKTGLFSTYLFTIARNLCFDVLKTWERKHVFTAQERLEERAKDPSGGPSEWLEKEEIGEIVRREILALPRDQREVLLLSKYSELSYEDIARIVESTPTAVKQKTYRAMIKLRQNLKKLDE